MRKKLHCPINLLSLQRYNVFKMKKTVRTIWIAVLSAVAFLTACVSGKGLTKSERDNLIRERDSIENVIREREGACVYGSPEIIKSFGEETQRLREQLNEINARLNGDDQKKK